MDNLLHEELPKGLVEALKKPLPKEAVSQHPTKPYLSSIKAIYVVERLNDVFGLGGWHIKNEIVEKVPLERYDKKAEEKYEVEMVVVKSTLTIPKYGIVVENYGGNDNDDLGDAYKGACTDALTKIGAYLYIGMDVYKGIKESGVKESKLVRVAGKTNYVSGKATEKQKNYIKRLIKQKGKPMAEDEWFETLTFERASQAIENLTKFPDSVADDGEERVIQR